MAHQTRGRRCRPISFRRAVDRSLAEPDDVVVVAVDTGEADGERHGRPRKREPPPQPPQPPQPAAEAARKSGFWRGLLHRKKGAHAAASVSASEPQLLAPSDPAPMTSSEARVLAWRQRNVEAMSSADATAPGNRAFSVYIPADPADYGADLGGPLLPPPAAASTSSVPSPAHAPWLVTVPRRRNSLTYGEEEDLEVVPGRLQLAR